MNWTQPICSTCFCARHPDREPVRLRAGPWEKCCDCGRSTQDGIYIRVDPRTVQYPSSTRK